MDVDEDKLIIEVNSRPIIFNKGLGDYKKVNKREDAWKEIATALNTEVIHCFVSDVNLCKKRWRSLRDGFIKHHRLLRNTPSGAAGGKKKIWPYYNQLEFLIPHVDFKETVEDSLGELLSAMDQPTNVESQLPLQPEVSDDNLSEHQKTQEHSTTSDKRKLQRNKKRITSEESSEDKLLNILSKDTDYDESFLYSLLPIFKRLTPQQNTKARIQIQQILYEIEFDTPAYTPQSSHSAFSPPGSDLSVRTEEFSTQYMTLT
ncbi:madf domain transcription factor [Holotrichia oblita]|uniref:Madf domain transcription factor n=1 Tax=Holotrichia oblita TaxID=644536 RepID=A0ACB9TFR8_HOLOL|nr:madf domain transcription factor [Holotrichia oblita]